MSLAGKTPWHWLRRTDPVVPLAVVAWGDNAVRLHARLCALSAEHLMRLVGTASRDVLVVSGQPADLPWVDGAAYAAPCDEAPALWLPTLYQPDMPGDLLSQALLRRHPRGTLLLWPTPAAIVPLDRQLPLSDEHLQRIGEHWGTRPGRP